MKPSIAALALLTLVSCDKAGKLAEEASSKVRDQVTQASSAVREQVASVTSGETKNEPDPELAKLVDRNDQGAVFRKDLPFPTRLEINHTQRSQTSTRLFETSAIEKRTGTLKGIVVSSAKYERAGDHIRVTDGEISFTDPTVKDEEGKTKLSPDNPFQQMAASPPRSFSRKNGAWKADDSAGFAGAALNKDLPQVFDLLLQEHSLAPRPMWFGNHRIPVGGEITVEGKSLPMLVAGATKGSLKLKLESFDAVAGHPCGVFAISGEYSRKHFPDFNGKFTDEEVAIQSGKVWLSLIHPLVLKWDIDVVHSYHTGDKRGPGLRGQGRSQITATTEWKALPP